MQKLKQKFNKWLEEVFQSGRQFSPETLKEFEETAKEERLSQVYSRSSEQERSLLHAEPVAIIEAERLGQMLDNAKSPKELDLESWVSS